MSHICSISYLNQEERIGAEKVARDTQGSFSDTHIFLNEFDAIDKFGSSVV